MNGMPFVAQIPLFLLVVIVSLFVAVFLEGFLTELFSGQKGEAMPTPEFRNVRVKLANLDEAKKRLNEAGIAYHIVSENAGVHARTSERMAELKVACSGNHFHKLVEDFADTRDYRD